MSHPTEFRVEYHPRPLRGGLPLQPWVVVAVYPLPDGTERMFHQSRHCKKREAEKEAERRALVAETTWPRPLAEHEAEFKAAGVYPPE